MAGRMFKRERLALEQAVVDLFMRVTFGATGAPTLDTANSKGIKSIVRNSAGKYTITLSDAYNRLLSFDMTQIGASSGASALAAPVAQVVSEAVNTYSAPTIVVQYRAIDNSTATDPASGEEARFQFVLKNSSV